MTTHRLSFYGDPTGDGEWCCECGDSFGMSIRLASLHMDEMDR